MRKHDEALKQAQKQAVQRSDRILKDSGYPDKTGVPEKLVDLLRKWLIKSLEIELCATSPDCTCGKAPTEKRQLDCMKSLKEDCELVLGSTRPSLRQTDEERELCHACILAGHLVILVGIVYERNEAMRNDEPYSTEAREKIFEKVVVVKRDLNEARSENEVLYKVFADFIGKTLESIEKSTSAETILHTARE
ncbi:hypothetical protein K491DRAFT_714150 [Lophiostoma macrostomum CBS 122681]|uniref:Uncharacterized protein n=1 Tax=Lophiostoma macrostomum CBS 122681 TaxID=1314788 RepID=A0A6A6TFV8_9PLEO|nr:hypothetical protein K491DRAFT_714150 [Lophiostoma macrostomum CBS 122681]